MAQWQKKFEWSSETFREPWRTPSLVSVEIPCGKVRIHLMKEDVSVRLNEECLQKQEKEVSERGKSVRCHFAAPESARCVPQSCGRLIHDIHGAFQGSISPIATFGCICTARMLSGPRMPRGELLLQWRL